MDRVNILLVDDQLGKLLTYEAILDGMGENLLKAQNAREALAYLLKEEIAVVLMDVNMPDMDGFELARLIREHPRCDRAAIIFVSAVHLSDVDRLRGYDTGAVDYVSVPVVPEILRAKIGVFVDLYRKTVMLERLNRTLEDRVAARTAELETSVMQLQQSEQQLRRQAEQLADTDRRKNEFLAMLAHELRNPLQPIRAALDLLRAPVLTGDQREWGYGLIERQIAQLVRLVEDLVDASRISSGKLSLRRERVDLGPVVASAVEANGPLAARKGQQLKLDPVPGPLLLSGDPVRLHQVFLNIVNNAVKFTPPGGHVRVRFEAAGQGQVGVRVVDDGIGIAPADLGRVFEFFYQAEPAAEETRSGLGIGLALVRQLVELHAGSVEAHSAGPGRGSEFVVRLPMTEAPASHPQIAGARPDDASGARRPRRILVVDDNRDAATSLALMLKLAGHDVETVFDGEQAVAAAAAFAPEFVLMDLGMPRLDGHRAARALRAGPGGRGMSLVAITGWSDDEERRKAREAGFDRFMVKPVPPTDLLALLASIEGQTMQ